MVQTMASHLWRSYLVGILGAAAVHAALTEPTGTDLVWMAVAWAAVAATVGGILLHRPARPGPWWLTAGGLSGTALAAVVAPASLDLAEGSARAIAGDLLHLGSYLAIGGAVLWFTRLQAPGGNREATVDASIVTLALASVLWAIVIDPGAFADDLGLSGRVVYVVAPLLPAGVTAICLRLIVSAGSRLPSARLLGAAWILAFAGSATWVILLKADAFAPGGWPDLLWIAALGCAGASALHPSMAAMGAPVPQVQRTVSTGRIAVLGVALLATPAALLFGSGTFEARLVAPVAGSGLVALLVLARLTRLVQDREAARAALEVHALRQEAIAHVGAAALTERPTDEVYEEAATLATVGLDGVVVTIRSAGAPVDPAHPRPTFGRVPMGELPITDGDRTTAVLEATGDGTRALRHDEHAFLVSIAAVLSSMGARRAAEDDLRRRAMYDDLTGLPNRVLLLDRMREAIAARDRGPVGVLFVDLDGFKAVNDAYGHEAGDSLLATIGERLGAVIREGDTVGRMAGDEFVVVAPACDGDELAGLSARLLSVIGQPIALGEALIGVSATVGAAIAAPTERDPAAVLRRADVAMYAAKPGSAAPSSASVAEGR